MKQIDVAIIGCGGITLQNHLPGLTMSPATTVGSCDMEKACLQSAIRQTGLQTALTRVDSHWIHSETPDVKPVESVTVEEHPDDRDH